MSDGSQVIFAAGVVIIVVIVFSDGYTIILLLLLLFAHVIRIRRNETRKRVFEDGKYFLVDGIIRRGLGSRNDGEVEGVERREGTGGNRGVKKRKGGKGGDGGSW